MVNFAWIPLHFLETEQHYGHKTQQNAGTSHLILQRTEHSLSNNSF